MTQYRTPREVIEYLLGRIFDTESSANHSEKVEWELQQAREDMERAQRQHLIESREPATYRCHTCGCCVTFAPREYERVHWLAHKFGFTHHIHAINRLQTCCDDPNYYSDTLDGEGPLGGRGE